MAEAAETAYSESVSRELSALGESEVNPVLTEVRWRVCTGATVSATVLEAYRGKKQIVFKMKAKKHYRRKNGHRQELTKFLVTDVTM
jgi:ribosomal protein L21